MYRKKFLKVSNQLLNELIEEVKSKFYKSVAPQYLKDIVKKLPIIFNITYNKNASMVASATALSIDSNSYLIKKLKLKSRISDSRILNDENYFFIIEVNVKIYSIFTKRGLKKLLAHELAHLLSIYKNKEVDEQFHMSYSTPDDHNDEWKQYCKWMGGNAEVFIYRQDMLS